MRPAPIRSGHARSRDVHDLGDEAAKARPLGRLMRQSLDRHDQVDGVGNQLRDRDLVRLSKERVHAPKRLNRGRGIAMDGADPARVPGPPGLQHRINLRPAHFPDDDSVGGDPKAPFHQLGGLMHPGEYPIAVPFLGAHLKLQDILDGRDPLMQVLELIDDRVREGGLTRLGPPDHENVLSRVDRADNRLTLFLGHDPGGHILLKRNDPGWTLSDVKAGAWHDRRQVPVKAKPVPGKFRIEDEATGSRPDDLIDGVRHDADHLRGQVRRENVPGPVGGPIEPVRKDLAIRIAANFDDLRIFEKRRNRRAHGGLQHPKHPMSGGLAGALNWGFLRACHFRFHVIIPANFWQS